MNFFGLPGDGRVAIYLSGLPVLITRSAIWRVVQTEVVLMFIVSWVLSSRIYNLMQRYAPSNIVLHHVHTRTGLKWGPLVGLAGIVVYGLMLIVARTVVEDGGPGFVNLFVLIGFWNLIRFAFLIPVSIVRLARVHYYEKQMLRDRAQSRVFVGQAVR